MKTNLCDRRKCVAIVALTMAALLLIPPAFVRVGGVTSAQSGSGERTSTPPKKTPPKTTQPKTTPRKSTPPARASPPAKTTPRQAQSFSESLSGVVLEMVLIPAGTFTMGSSDSETGPSEGPQHRVTVKSFYMGKYEVTQAQWRAVMGGLPPAMADLDSKFKGDRLPVMRVSWNEAVEFCRKLSQVTGREYRLPTEAEWEYAARARTTTPFAYGSSLSSEQANFDGDRPYGGAAKGVDRKQTIPVGSFQPNGFGLYDMHGNVWELCQDYSHPDYNGAPTNGSAWMKDGNSNYRIVRGGSWETAASACSSAFRMTISPNTYILIAGFQPVGSAIGFRVVASTKP